MACCACSPGVPPRCSCAHLLLQDPLAAGEYVGDIISYYRRVEPQYRVAPDYMTSQVCSAWVYKHLLTCLLAAAPHYMWQELLTCLQSACWQGIFTMLAICSACLVL